MPWQRLGTGVAGTAIFLLLLVCCTEVACFAQHALALHLSLGWHVVVQAAAVAVVASRAEAFCTCAAMRQEPSKAVMSSLARGFDWLAAASLQPVRGGAVAAPGAVGAVGNASLADAATAIGGGQLPSFAAEGVADCWAVMVLLEILLGESLLVNH